MSSRLFLYFTATLLCTHCMAQQGSYRLDFELSKQNFVDSVVIDYDQRQVVVPVEMNGRTYHFLLDTGAGHGVVYDDQPIEGCQPAGTIKSRDAIGRESVVQLLTLPPLTVGSLTLTGCQVTVQHRAIPRSGIDGILGFDIVCRGLLMKIDVKQKLLILTDQKKFFNKEQGHTVPYKLDYHVPYVQVEPFAGYKERVLFDTGSRQLYSINKRSFDQGEQACLKQNADQIEGRSMGCHAIGHQGTEPFGPVVFLALDSLRLGNFSFCDVHTLTTQGGSHLGAQLLEYGAVIFNPHRRRLIFQPYEHPYRTFVSNRQVEKAIINDKGQAAVGLVWEGSEAYRAGLRQGDIILKADDQPIPSFADYLAFRPLSDHIYNITVRDSRGFQKEVKMTW